MRSYDLPSPISASVHSDSCPVLGIYQCQYSFLLPQLLRTRPEDRSELAQGQPGIDHAGDCRS